MNDILPEEARSWHFLEAAFRSHAELHGYAEIRTPVVEHTTLFSRQIGETTDVVEKEMYSFERHGDPLTLRPEGTAGAARAYVEHGIHTKEPVTRWYYLGPMFRAERPAKGRYRQFYQAGCEHLGDPGPLCDAEMIDFVARYLRAIGIDDFAIHINSLGSAGAREKYRDALRAHLTPLRASLSEDSQRRLERNPLRILDSKDPHDQEAIAGAPSILELLDDADREHWNGLRRYLDVLGVAVIVDPTLVRGLDYYTRTLFEFRATSADLGAQSTLLGGGRYDNMIESLGGPKVPAIGFGMGLERLLLSRSAAPAPRAVGCYLAPLAPAGAEKALLLARELRALGVAAEVDGRGARLKAMLRRADALGAKLCAIFGEDEVQHGMVTVKDLAGRVQEQVPFEGAARRIVERIRQAGSGPGPAPGGTTEESSLAEGGEGRGAR